MNQLKHGVELSRLQSQTVLGYVLAKSVLEHQGTDATITSGSDSAHGRYTNGERRSLHYVGLAFDLRSKLLATSRIKHTVLKELKRALGSNFDILLEGEGTDNEHYHIEYDPKNTFFQNLKHLYMDGTITKEEFLTQFNLKG